MTLNVNLLPQDAPIANGGAISPYSFDGSNERGVINAMKIKNFSFNSGTGGTLTLGGTANGSGFMQLKNENGTVIFSADYEGHHYYGTSGSEAIQVNLSGFHAYGTAGTVEQIRVDDLGFHAYGSAGTAQELIKVDDIGFHAYDANGVEQFRVSSDGLYAYGTTTLVQRFRSTSSATVSYGAIGFSSAVSAFYISSLNANDLYLIGATDRSAVLSSDETTLVAGGTAVNIRNSASNIYNFWDPSGGGGYWTLTMDSDKTAIVETSEGYNALYCIESPEVWFMDFCESKNKIDPLFLEVTKPPYRFIKCEDGWFQVWGRRKGHEHKRFEKKTKQEAEKNNQFWSIPKVAGKRQAPDWEERFIRRKNEVEK